MNSGSDDGSGKENVGQRKGRDIRLTCPKILFTVLLWNASKPA
jgi:hypothetical protein